MANTLDIANGNMESCSSKTGVATGEKVKAKMAEWGDGSRAIVRIQWKGDIIGHVFIAEQQQGKTIFIDPQHPQLDAELFFKLAKACHILTSFPCFG